MAINSLTSASRGFAGMASGMNTEELVNKMLSGTQAKIDAKKQSKAVLQYKQEMYREIASKMKAFQNTYFSFTNSSSNLLSGGFFKSMTAETTSKFFKVLASSDANAGSFKVNSISQLASNHKEVSSVAASGKLEGKYNADALTNAITPLLDGSNNIKITVGKGASAQEVSIDIKNIIGKSSQDATVAIQDALKAAGAGANAEFLNGKVQIFANNKDDKISITSTALAGKMLSGTTNGEGGGSFVLDTKAALPAYNITVDGVVKKITINPLTTNADGTSPPNAQNVADQLNAGIKNAFGNGYGISYDSASEKINISVANSTSKVTINGDKNAMAIIGIKPGQSNKVVTGASLQNVNFATSLIGSMQKFTINGVDFSFDSSKSLTNIMADINTSNAGVKVTYDPNADRFNMESTTQGDLKLAPGESPFTMSQSEGNLLNVMFGTKSGDNFSTGTFNKANIEQSVTFDPAAFSFTGGDVKINVGGSIKTYKLTSAATPQELVDQLNAKLKEDFYAEDASGNKTGTIEFKITGNTVTINDDLYSMTSGGEKAYVTGDGLKALGFDPNVDGNSKLSQIGLADGIKFSVGTGASVTLGADATVNDLVQAFRDNGIDAKLETLGQQPFIRVAGVDIPMRFEIGSELFGSEVIDSSVGTANGEFDASKQVLGQNAKAIINGNEVERSSNNFTVDGVTITLTGTTAEAEDVNITQNTDKIFDTLKKFVEDYNKLVDGINDMLGGEATNRDYKPLTQDQKNAMSDKEVEMWEKKAKGGLLRGDATLTTVLSGLRSTLYTKPEGAPMALYNLGIESNDFYGKKDNITIKDESDLKAKIAANPDAIMKLFTDSEQGLATLMNNAIDKAAKASSTSPGALVQQAGAAGMIDNDSAIAKQMKLIDDSIVSLEDKYASEYERYWKQFNNMEMMLQKMNSQSSWLSQQMG